MKYVDGKTRIWRESGSVANILKENNFMVTGFEWLLYLLRSAYLNALRSTNTQIQCFSGTLVWIKKTCNNMINKDYAGRKMPTLSKIKAASYTLLFYSSLGFEAELVSTLWFRTGFLIYTSATSSPFSAWTRATAPISLQFCRAWNSSLSLSMYMSLYAMNIWKEFTPLSRTSVSIWALTCDDKTSQVTFISKPLI